MSSVSRNFAQGAPSIKNVVLTGDGTYSSPAVADVNLQLSSVFVIDCSDLQVTNDYSQVYIDAETGASGSLPGKEVTFIFKTAEDENGKNTQSLVITFSPNFTRENSVSYTTGVSQLNPNPVITLVSDGEKFSVKTMNYMKSSEDPFNPLTNKLLLIGHYDNSYYALSRNNGTIWDVQQVGDDSLNAVNGFAWNGSAWVVVGSDGDTPDICLLYSTDAINWVAPSGNQPFQSETAYAIAWNDSLKLWIAGGYSDNGYALAYSPTGYDNWQRKDYDSTDPIGDNDGEVYGIATSGEYCVAVGACYNSEAYTICRSTNGIDWQATNGNPFSDENSYCNTVATNGNTWVVGGRKDNRTVSLAWSENNGVDWYACTSVGGGNDPFSISASNSECLSVATNGTMWVAGGYGTKLNGGNPDTIISLAYSFNGKEWTAVTGDLFSIDYDSCTAVVWNGSAWFAASNNSTPILTSQDGIHWTPVSADPFNGYSGGGTECFGIKHVLPFTPGLPSGLLSANELAVRAEKKAARKAVRDEERAKKDTRSNVSRGRRAEKSVVDVSGTHVGRASRGPRESRAEKSVVDVSGTRVGRASRGPRGPRESRAEKSVVDASGTRVGREQRNRKERSRGKSSSRRVAIVEPLAPVVAEPVATA